jgi:hypothetical protein
MFVITENYKTPCIIAAYVTVFGNLFNVSLCVVTGLHDCSIYFYVCSPISDCYATALFFFLFCMMGFSVALSCLVVWYTRSSNGGSGVTFHIRDIKYKISTRSQGKYYETEKVTLVKTGSIWDRAFVLIFRKIRRLRHLELYFEFNCTSWVSYSNSIPRSLRKVCLHDVITY